MEVVITSGPERYPHPFCKSPQIGGLAAGGGWGPKRLAHYPSQVEDALFTVAAILVRAEASGRVGVGSQE